eukprot:CCRYP_014378-RA/>CCRYP_014378-RA protein AED:0.07 eAED:0.07 QI:300/1/1/1/1/1/2/346/664
MTSTYKSTTHLSHPTPTTTSTIQSTTAHLSTTLTSHPQHGKWWMRTYGIGPRSLVKQLTHGRRRRTHGRRLGFRVGTFPVEEVRFGDASLLMVVCGPRVCLYGGRAGMTSDFHRKLAGRRAVVDDNDDNDDEGGDLMFGKKNNGGEDNDSKLEHVNPDRQISTGGHLATAACGRSDHRLVAVGTEGGTVRICDVNSRATLRSFSCSKAKGGGDRKSVRDVCWMRDGKRVVAGGDDGVVRVWNVKMDEVEVELVGHGDSVRCVTVVSYKDAGKGAKERDAEMTEAVVDSFQSEWSQLIVSGSYDHTIRVWDISNASEGEQCTSIMNHGDPVQALLVLPPINNAYSALQNKKSKTKYDNIPLLASAGGTTIKIWNPMTGACLGTYPTKHAKTITCMCLLDVMEEDDDNTSTPPQRKRQIITGGLDGLLRIHSATPQDIQAGSLPFLHGMQFSDPISALAISHDMSRIAIGFTTGIVMVHQRRQLPSETVAKKRRDPKPGTYSFFMRGAHEKSHDPDDYLLMPQKKQKLAEYDVLLRKFRYGDALDKVLETRQPQNVIAVIEELGKRRGLSLALSNRDEESLESILSFTIRFIDNPQYTPYLIGVAHLLCDIYGSVLGQSAIVDELFSKLKTKVTGECAVQKMLSRLLGQIDFVMASAEMQSLEDGR